MDLARELRHTYVFRGIAPSVISTLAALATVRTYQGGDVLVRQFEKSDDLFVLLEGEALIRGFLGDTVAEFGPGSVIGEMALLDEQPRSATVVAKGKVRAALIPSDLLRNLMESDPAIQAAIYGNLARVLSRKVRSMNAQVEAPRRDLVGSR